MASSEEKKAEDKSPPASNGQAATSASAVGKSSSAVENIPVTLPQVHKTGKIVITAQQVVVPQAEKGVGLTADAFANGFSTLVGALLGAGLAYWFQNLAAKRQARRAAVASAHRTLFMVLQQINTILLIQKDFVFDELKSPARYISIMAAAPFDVNRNIMRVDDVAFLLDDPQGRQVLYELYIAQDNYIETLNQWNLRSHLHLQQVQPALERAGFDPPQGITLEQIDKALGPLLAGAMKRATDNCVTTQQRTFERLIESKVKLRAYLVRRFTAAEKFMDFEFPETWGLVFPGAKSKEEK